MIALWFTRLRPYLVGAAFLGVLLLWMHERRQVDYSNDAYDALAKVYNRRMVADSLALDSARAQLSVKTREVTRDVYKYRTLRDTLNIHDTIQVKQFVERANAMERSCSDLQASASLFVSRCDSAQSSLRIDRDLWKTRYEGSRPSTWDAAKEWGIRLGIGYVAYKVGQGHR